MSKSTQRDKVILIPVDGASNIKLEALDFDTLTTLHSRSTESPATEHGGLRCNDTGAELDWFDRAIRELPESCRNVAAIAPVARGCSGGLVGHDNTLIEVPGKRLTLAYTHRFPAEVDEAFVRAAGKAEEFFLETGSIRDFPGSLTLLKRFVFEAMVRPELVARAAGFAHYGLLLGGHFCGDDFLGALQRAADEHSYWMCHSGARAVSASPGKRSGAARRVPAFGRLVPERPAVAYRALGTMPEAQAAALGLKGDLVVVPGGHDTCLSHIPIISAFQTAFPERAGQPVVHVDAGTWTMIAQLGGSVSLPPDGYLRDMLIQGTVDGAPVVTARYGGGADFAHLKKMAETSGVGFDSKCGLERLVQVLERQDCFVLPNVNPAFAGTGPFPRLQGRILNETAFFGDAATAYCVANLATAMTTACQVQAIGSDASIPLIVTAGGSKDPWFATLLATLTGRKTYAMFDREGRALAETTSLGAALVGKAACLGGHPHQMDTRELGVQCREVPPLAPAHGRLLADYRARWQAAVVGA
jgi:sugar (pentulose or hexulose) kinase